MKRFGLSFMIRTAILILSTAHPGLAEPPVVIHRAPILGQALAYQKAGRHDLARQLLRHLLQSSPDAQDEAFVLSLHDQIGRERPWIVTGGWAILPSSNIDRVSLHRVFETQLGTLIIPEPHFGIGLWTWGEAGYSWVTGPGQSLALVAGLGRSVQQDASQNRSDLRLDLSHESYSRRGHWGLSMAVLTSRQGRSVPEPNKSDFDQLSLKFGVTTFGGPKASHSANLTLETTQFRFRDHQSGPAARIGLATNRALDDRTSIGMNLTLGRSLPQAGHLANRSIAFSMGVNRAIGRNLTMGGSIELAQSQFDGVFPTLAFARRDKQTVVGFSLSDSRIKILGKVPLLSCSWRSNRSNVALYEFQSTDCQITLKLDF